jgi:hypothetical protein
VPRWRYGVTNSRRCELRSSLGASPWGAEVSGLMFDFSDRSEKNHDYYFEGRLKRERLGMEGEKAQTRVLFIKFTSSLISQSPDT